MKKQIIYGLGLVLAAPLCAQGVIYSPKKLDTKTEGGLYCYYFTRYGAGHMQNVDGENRGKAAIINAINLRIDTQLSASNFRSLGRKWTNVKVSIGEGDMSKFGRTFASNFITTPTVVFNKAWSLPDFKSKSLTTPAVYGGLKGEYRVPFSSVFVYTGKSDILHDWLYAGGTLNNNATWGTRSRTYYFDGFRTPTRSTSAVGSSYRYIPATRLNNTTGQVCNDSAVSITTGSYMISIASLYGKHYAIENYRGRILFYSYTYYTAPGAPVLHAFSPKNNFVGVDVGTSCNKLHVTAPMVVMPRMTFPKSANAFGYTGYRLNFIKWDAAFAGLTITGQGAWADSVTKKFNLTRAREFTLPSALPGTEPPILRNAVYSSSNTATTGFSSTSFVYSPAIAYTTK